MTESRGAYTQIADKMIPRVATLNQTFSLAPPHQEQTVFYAPETVELMKNNPELVPNAMESYDHLVEEYNSMVQKDSPLLTLFPHSEHLRRVLESNTKELSLPPLVEMKKSLNWKKIMTKGVEDAMGYIEIGNCVEPRDGSPASFLKERPTGNQIVSPGRTDLDPTTRLAAIEGHVVERVYLAWLEEKGYKGSKDEVLGMFDEMIQYQRLVGKPSPLEESYIKLRWVKPEKLAKLQHQFELQTDEIPGAISGTLPSSEHEGTIFNQNRCLNYYEGPNPLLSYLVARKIGTVSEKIGKQLGVDPNEPFSAILDTGKGISTVAFGEWRKEGKIMHRSCEIRTRGSDVVGSIDHFSLFATKNPDGSLEYLNGKYGFDISFQHLSVQDEKNWIRTFVEEEHEDEMTARPAIPTMISKILSQVQGTSIDYFAMKHPDGSSRAVVEYLFGKDTIVDEKKDRVLIPAEKRRGFELRSGEVLFTELSLSQVVEVEKKKSDPLGNYAVCDEVFEAKYGKAVQPITAMGHDSR